MTKEQIFKELGNFSATEQLRIQAAITACEKTNKECLLYKAKNKKELVEFVKIITDNYNKRQEAKARRQAKEEEEAAKLEATKKLINKIEKYGYTLDDLSTFVDNMVRDKHNKEIEEQIAKLQAQLL